MRKKKKASVPVAVVLLTLLTLVLIVASLTAFLKAKSSYEKKISSVGLLQGVYAKEQLINFYLSKNIQLNEAVNAVGGNLEGESVVIRENYEDKENSIEIIYKFIPKLKENI